MHQHEIAVRQLPLREQGRRGEVDGVVVVDRRVEPAARTHRGPGTQEPAGRDDARDGNDDPESAWFLRGAHHNSATIQARSPSQEVVAKDFYPGCIQAREMGMRSEGTAAPVSVGETACRSTSRTSPCCRMLQGDDRALTGRRAQRARIALLAGAPRRQSRARARYGADGADQGPLRPQHPSRRVVDR